MSQDSPSFFANLPGFDFLKSLSSAQTATLNPWLKPTLDPKELDQRIQELKTVHFWLEQNAKALAATIQALEVQRMTLSTLQQMNVDWKTAFEPKKNEAKKSASQASSDPPEAMRLWTNLASQFGQIAQQSMSDMQRHARDAVSAVGDRVAQSQSASGSAAKTAGSTASSARSKKPAAKRSRKS